MCEPTGSLVLRLPQTDAAALPIQQCLERSNPHLATALAAIDNARRSAAPENGIEELEALLFEKADCNALVDGLARWETLPEKSRIKLIGDIHSTWMCAGAPERPTECVRPGTPGWRMPQREASMLRAIDRKTLLVAGAVVGFIVAMVALFS